ncbi:MAG: hypothetical protein Q4Q07_10360 [Tissierellia bacterium]|nr:hypothetical protein [Tissierellia bacterium]
MPINNIEYAKLMMTKLDQAAVIGATSGWMEANAGQVIYNGGDEVKIPTMSTTGLGDYDRDDGFVQGSITLKYETYKMTQDRGRTFQIDRMDENESGFVATATNTIKIFQDTQVVPELDAYRYSKIAALAEGANQTEAITLTADNALTKLKEHIAAIEDVIGEGVPLIITVPAAVMALIEDSPKIGKSINVADFKQGGLNFKVKTFNDHVIRRVPKARLKTEYEILDGKTGGQEAGGFKPTVGAKDINWIITPANIPLAISKTDKLRVFNPDVNQKADAWKIDYRKYHDLWIMENKLNQIMVCTTV